MLSDVKIWAVAYATSALIFVGMDYFWLSQMGQTFYRKILGDMALPDFRPLPALLFYVIFILGIVVLAIAPALEAGRWQIALFRGLIFGLCAYATYDLTNHATLKNWTVALSAVDIAWGTFLTGLAALIGYFASSAFAGAGDG